MPLIHRTATRPAGTTLPQRAILRACAHPGCPSFAARGARYCAAHASDAARTRDTYELTRRRDDPDLAAARAIRNTSRYRRCIATFRATHPLCCDPFGLHGDLPAATAQVHHVIGVASAPALAYTPANMAPLCQPCHARVEGMERRNEPTAHLFAPTAAQPPATPPIAAPEPVNAYAPMSADSNRGADATGGGLKGYGLRPNRC